MAIWQPENDVASQCYQVYAVREIQLEREPPFTSTFMEENEHGFVSKPKNKSDRHLCLSNKIHHDIVVLQYAMATAGTMDPLPWTRSQTTGGEVGEKCLAMCFCVGWCSLGAVLVAVGTEFLVMINGYRTLFSRLKSCNYFGEKTLESHGKLDWVTKMRFKSRCRTDSIICASSVEPTKHLACTLMSILFCYIFYIHVTWRYIESILVYVYPQGLF